MLKVGFIGLGAQGGAMAQMIAPKFPLYIYDRRNEAYANFDSLNTTIAPDAFSLAEEVDILCVCVRNDDDLIDVTGNGEIFRRMKTGSQFVIHSTVRPSLCRFLGEAANGIGIDLLDAPVSGSGQGALMKSLLVMVGGSDGGLVRIRPVLETYAGCIHHLGSIGRGMEAKLINNLLFIANTALAAEALDLGASWGFDEEKLRNILLAGSGASFALAKTPRTLDSARASYLRSLLGKDYSHIAEIDHGQPLPTILDQAACAFLQRLQ